MILDASDCYQIIVQAIAREWTKDDVFALMDRLGIGDKAPAGPPPAPGSDTMPDLVEETLNRR